MSVSGKVKTSNLIDEVLDDYDDLERDDILATLLFATQVKSIYRVVQ
ncbi:MAG: hypothetical protein GDA43_24415 [Hormoscilla sp. SP5CHS1]|nr:hypothetical protein [Hormoscilla sp. SP12CHS1]MBC6455938.1 hypothetical protein [Hormoscilla sp. SP5CHS1]MBC6472775.1 hypothetical protein [Hormoscilla sp. GM102CHS1]